MIKGRESAPKIQKKFTKEVFEIQKYFKITKDFVNKRSFAYIQKRNYTKEM